MFGVWVKERPMRTHRFLSGNGDGRANGSCGGEGSGRGGAMERRSDLRTSLGPGCRLDNFASFVKEI